jgi:hypothetical protein
MSDYTLAPDEARDAYINDADVDAHDPDEVRLVTTKFINPPVPYRGSDWCAFYTDDPEGVHGWGATEAEAVEDLKAVETED